MTILGTLASGGLAPGAPTIGTATDGGTGTSVNVAFTAPAWRGKGSGTVTYTATSSPGNLTGTSTSSPITVSGLTTGTAYTFTVRATTSYGITGPSSAASNSVTPVAPFAFESIVSVNGSGSSPTITFSNIPQTYKMLQFRGVIRYTSGGGGSDDLLINYNGTNTYASGAMKNINGSTLSVGNYAGGAATAGGYIQSFGWGTGATGGAGSTFILDIMDYTSTSKAKVAKFRLAQLGSTTVNNNNVGVVSIISNPTNTAITSVTFAGASAWNFDPNCGIALYGIK